MRLWGEFVLLSLYCYSVVLHFVEDEFHASVGVTRRLAGACLVEDGADF